MKDRPSKEPLRVWARLVLLERKPYFAFNMLGAMEWSERETKAD